MATMSSSSASILDDRKGDLLKQIRSHDIAIAELNSLSSNRAVYRKNGNIFFCTSIQKATANEQRQLDLAKTKLQNLDRP